MRAQMPVKRDHRVGLFPQTRMADAWQQGMMRDSGSALPARQSRDQLHVMTSQRQIGGNQARITHDSRRDQRMHIDTDQRPRRSHSTTCAPCQRSTGTCAR